MCVSGIALRTCLTKWLPEQIDDVYDHGYDDMYGMHHRERENDYYDEKHYIRITPHILCTPVLAELPRAYGDTNEKDDILLVAVSYYFDEDEFAGHRSYKRFKATDVGDETEVKRGQYVASAIMSYMLLRPNLTKGHTN